MISEITDAQRIERMRAELARGFEVLADVGQGVAVFGSARTPPDDPDYALAVEVGRRLGEAGMSVITGGGPGIMAAANKGARESGTHSVGLTIDLPHEQDANPYHDLEVDFHYFFARKVMFARYSSAVVGLPGGFGTLDELFEVLTLIQTGKIRFFPVILVGTSFWGGLVDWLRERMLAEGNISPEDLEILTLTDDVDEVVALCARACARQWANE